MFNVNIIKKIKKAAPSISVFLNAVASAKIRAAKIIVNISFLFMMICVIIFL